MKLACVVGAWHWPSHIFRRIPRLAGGADLFVVAHRHPDSDLVSDEVQAVRMAATKDPLSLIDLEMRQFTMSEEFLDLLDWSYQDAPNCSGDWTFFNQWLETHDYRQYDVILNCHDDTYFRPRVNVFDEAIELLDGSFGSRRKVRPLMLANGKFPEAPYGYVRGSFEFWTRELLDMLGGKIPIPDMKLDRTGMTDTPKDFEALMEWNAIGDPLRRFFVDNKLVDRVAYLSDYYRVSPWVIEGERGLISRNVGAPWSFNAGLEKYPL